MVKSEGREEATTAHVLATSRNFEFVLSAVHEALGSGEYEFVDDGQEASAIITAVEEDTVYPKGTLMQVVLKYLFKGDKCYAVWHDGELMDRYGDFGTEDGGGGMRDEVAPSSIS